MLKTGQFLKSGLFCGKTGKSSNTSFRFSWRRLFEKVALFCTHKELIIVNFGI